MLGDDAGHHVSLILNQLERRGLIPHVDLLRTGVRRLAQQLPDLAGAALAVDQPAAHGFRTLHFRELRIDDELQIKIAVQGQHPVANRRHAFGGRLDKLLVVGVAAEDRVKVSQRRLHIRGRKHLLTGELGVAASRSRRSLFKHQHLRTGVRRLNRRRRASAAETDDNDVIRRVPLLSHSAGQRQRHAQAEHERKQFLHHVCPLLCNIG